MKRKHDIENPRKLYYFFFSVSVYLYRTTAKRQTATINKLADKQCIRRSRKRHRPRIRYTRCKQLRTKSTKLICKSLHWEWQWRNQKKSVCARRRGQMNLQTRTEDTEFRESERLHVDSSIRLAFLVFFFNFFIHRFVRTHNCDQLGGNAWSQVFQFSMQSSVGLFRLMMLRNSDCHSNFFRAILFVARIVCGGESSRLEAYIRKFEKEAYWLRTPYAFDQRLRHASKCCT